MTLHFGLSEKRSFEKWDHSNSISLMIIKCGIQEVFRGVTSEEVTNGKDFLAEIEKHFAKIRKAKTNTLLLSLISIKYKDKGNIRDILWKCLILLQSLRY